MDKIVTVAVPNDGIMEEATNAYIVGDQGGPVVVVDPGSAAGTETILRALAELGDPPVRDILLTHAHPDHAAGAGALREITGAPIWLHPAEQPVLERMKVTVPIGRELADGQVHEIDDLRFESLLTPGHAAGHIVFIEQTSRVTLAGDMVHGGGTVGIFPPFGSMVAYLDSLQRMLDHGVSSLLPGHGPAMPDGPATLRRYIAHRLNREREIYETLAGGVSSIDEIVALLYPDVLPHNIRAAGATVRAHLEKLIAEGRVRQEGEGKDSRYFAIGS